MKTLFIECNMGAAGDMLMAALLELIENKPAFIKEMNALGLEGVHVRAEQSVKCGIAGTHISVTINGEQETSEDVDMRAAHEHEHAHEHPHAHEHTHEHAHAHDHAHGHAHAPAHAHADMRHIEGILTGLSVSDSVKAHARAVYGLIAEAEAHAHGRPVDQVHFHEVGNLDAVADIVGVCLLIERIAADRIIVSPIHTGSGFVRCAHGVLPVPAPATAYILRGVPAYGGHIQGELCTPTGAALLRHFAHSFGPMPEMRVKKIGYGMGKKDFAAINCVRAFLGESVAEGAVEGPEGSFNQGSNQGPAGSSNQGPAGGPNETVAELICQVDDMTGEAMGFACEALLQAGARDVFTTAVQMKKNRPGTQLTCITDADKADSLATLMLKYTTTLGVRKAILTRYALDRHTESRATPCGPVRVKHAEGYGVKKSKLEYEDIAALARKHFLSLHEMEQTLLPYLQQEDVNE